jgi:hypothetical protein
MELLIIGIVKKELNVITKFFKRINNWTISGTDILTWKYVFEKIKKIRAVFHIQNRKV